MAAVCANNDPVAEIAASLPLGLLMRHKKLNKWLQLGGHADGNTDILCVALKEAREESGIEDIVFLQEDIFDIDVHQIPTINSTPSHKHYDIRFLLQANHEDFIKNEEAYELRWFSFEEINKDGSMFNESIRRMARKCLLIL